LGFSILQGLHQLAQKSTNTYLPFNEDNEMSFPSGAFNAKSGACFPIKFSEEGVVDCF